MIRPPQRKSYYLAALALPIILPMLLGLLGFFARNSRLLLLVPPGSLKGDALQFAVASGLWGGVHYIIFACFAMWYVRNQTAADIARLLFYAPLVYTLFSAVLTPLFLLMNGVPLSVLTEKHIDFFLGRMLLFYVYLVLIELLARLLLRVGLLTDGPPELSE